MATRDFGCWSVLLMLPSAILFAFRQAAWERCFPRPHKLHTAKEAMDVVAELMSDHGGGGAAFPYAQRAWELDPQNVQAAKFLAYCYMESRRFAGALPYLRVAVQGAHPESIYVVMLKQALAAVSRQTVARDDDAPSESKNKARH